MIKVNSLASSDDQRKSIMILASPIPATYLVGPAIAEFMRQFPKVRVKLLTSSWSHEVVEKGQYDLAVMDITGLRNNPTLECEELIKSPAKMCCNQSHPLLKLSKYTTSDLNNYPLALPTSLPEYVHHELSRLLNRPLIDNRCDADLYYESLLTIRHTLFHSETIAIAPHIAMTQSLNEQLKALNPTDWPTIDADFGIVKSTKRETTDVMNAMMDALFNVADRIRNESMFKVISS